VSDSIAYVALVVSFAAMLTAHVTIAWGLAFRAPRWRAAAALVVFPLALFWAHREKMHARVVVFGVAAIVYGVARALS
jgi:hypothetical protein